MVCEYIKYQKYKEGRKEERRDGTYLVIKRGEMIYSSHKAVTQKPEND